MPMRSDNSQSQNDALSKDAALHPTPRAEAHLSIHSNEPASPSSVHLNSSLPGPSRRPPPSPAQSPDPNSSSQFAATLSATEQRRQTAYKRARTVSPIIDENSSDLENDVKSSYSRSNSDLGEQESTEVVPSAQPTPLRQSISSADILNPPQNMSGSDQNIERLMTEKSLRLHDGAAAAAAAASGGTKGTEVTVDEQLPSYHEAVDDAPSSTDTSANAVARPTGQQQLDLIRPMKNRPLVAGDTWYLVSRAWYRRWNTACSDRRDSDPAEKVDVPIGPIDNSDLLHEDSSPSLGRLRQGIHENIDYEMLPEEGWKHLVNWYGSSGPLFARNVIEGLSPGQESVEFYPPIIRLLKLESDPTVSGPGPVSFSLSVSASLAELKTKAKELLDLGAVTDVDIRFYHFPDPTAGELETGLVHVGRVEGEGVDVIDVKEDKPDSYQPNVTLKSVGVDEIEMCLAVETRQVGRWQTDPAPAAPSSVKGIFAQQGDFFSNLQQNAASTSSSGAQNTASEAQGRVTRSQTATDRTMGRSRGLRGLNNLGNTCFMNSALQCLSNTYELQQYFVSGAYKEELNTDNPLGMGGAIADAFGSLITNIWNGQGGSFWPREFKYALSRFAPQFSGYAQHDSQELLAFLLDGLHEDLNRILKKPYIEAPDWEGGDEKDLVAFAKRQWDIYKARNDSVIVDLFQGQYRSTLVCPVCSKVSIKFDPFMYLTLPIPNKKMWRGQVYLVPSDASKPMQKFQVQLPAGSTVSKLRQKVAAQFGVETKRLVCGEVWHHRIYKWIDDYEPLVDIKEGDFVYFWEVPAAPRFSKQRHYRYHRTVEDAEDALDIPEEEQAILPVFANFASDAFGASSSQAFVSRRARSDAVGIPFFISVPKSDVNDVAAIRKRVLEGFSRFTSHSGDLCKAVEEANVVPAAAAAGPQPTSHVSDWEMVDDAATNNDAVEIVAPSRTDDGDVVTEIREDGETVVVPDMTTTSSSSGTETPAIVSSDLSLEEPKAATHAHAQPVMRIRFSVAEAGQGLPKGSESNADHLSEDLEERHARLAQRRNKASASSDEMAITDNEDDCGDAAPTKAIPLVYTGGAIVVTWSQSIKERGLLVESDSAQLWGEYEEVVDEAIRARDNAGPARPKTLSIEDCMDEFTKEEQLGEDDPWYCPTCKEFRQATKKFDLWKAPDILVVHLKRFSAGRHSRDKLNMLVDFPLEGLDLTERVEGTQALRRVQEEAKESGEELSESMLGSGILRPLEDNDDAVAVDRPIYDLYAVDNHFGGLGGGHYTAFAKSPSDGKWYEFDDSSVRPVANPETVKSSSAYLLFYRRRTTRPIGGKSRQKFQEAAKTKATAAEQAGGVGGVAADTQRNDAGEDSSDSSSDHTPDWSMNLRSGADDSMAEPAAGWSSLGNSPASSNRAPSPISDTGLESP